MSEPTLAPLYTWLIEPLAPEVQDAITRLRSANDVRHVAVMPDVHLAADVCVGVAIGTTHLIYPQAVGGDIGCGVLAVPFDAEAERISAPAIAGTILAGLERSGAGDSRSSSGTRYGCWRWASRTRCAQLAGSRLSA